MNQSASQLYKISLGQDLIQIYQMNMSTYRQSFPSFAASNDDIPTGLFAGATFQNCPFTFGSSCGMNSVSDVSSSRTSWKRALQDSTAPCGKFQKKTIYS